MPKNVQKAKDLKGLFIFHDEHHGVVYYDVFSRNGYILTNQDVKWYTISIAFLPLAVILLYGLVQLKFDMLLAICVAVIFYILTQILFRVLFLYKLPCVENYSIQKRKHIIDNLSDTYSKPRLIALIILLLALAILMSIYVYTSEFTGVTLVALWIIVLITCIFTIMVAIALKRKK